MTELWNHDQRLWAVGGRLAPRISAQFHSRITHTLAFTPKKMRNENMPSNNRQGFTLVELLIVVVILAILAAAIIPTFTDSTADAKASTALTNLNVLRGQIQLYKMQHGGLAPSATLVELTKQTNGSGTDGTDYGPYLLKVPANPFTNSDTVRAATANPPTAASGETDAGWLYHAASGNVWLDHADHLDK